MLLIEDSEPELELMSYLLRAGGYYVMTARTGEAGLALAEQASVKLIVCDVFLPGMNGYAVARRLKAHPGLRRIPVLAVTSLNQITSQEKLRAAGFDGYISKPIEPQTFAGQLESFLALTHASIRPPSAGRRILVVDDFPLDAERLRADLELSGCRVTLARSAAQAMELLAGGHFDLIVADIHSSEHDGFLFLSSVKANPVQRSIPFLFLSSSVWEEQERPVVLNLPRTRCLRRPLDSRRLLEEVETSLSIGREG